MTVEVPAFDALDGVDPPLRSQAVDQAAYRDQVEVWMVALPEAGDQVKAIGDATKTNADEAHEDATFAALDRAAAAASETQAAARATEAEAAQAAAEAAAGAAAAFKGTSATELTLSAGTKAFTASTLRQWGPGDMVLFVSAADPTTHRMAGPLNAYDPVTGIGEVEIETVGIGSGDRSDWLVSLAGERGPAAAVTLATEEEAAAGDGNGVMTAALTQIAIEAQALNPLPAYFGDGSQGNATVTGAVALSADAHYENLTVSGAGSIDLNGYRLFVRDTLDLTAAGAAAIHVNTTATAGTVGVGAAAGAAGENGGASGAAGSGGAGADDPGSAGAGGATVTPYVQRLLRTSLTRSELDLTLLKGGAGGRTGGGGGFETSEAGGGPGVGARGGNIAAIFARRINRGAGTAAGAISAKGVNGGAASPGTGLYGGGGGASGSGGGWIYLVYQTLLGAAKATALDVTAGNGSAGGDGAAGQQGGDGGASGAGGRVTKIDIQAGTVTHATGSASVAGSLNAGAVGGAGGVAATDQFSL